MKKVRHFQQSLVVLSCLFSGAALAQGTSMFVCTSEDGVRTYQNQDGGKNCLPLSLNPITVLPAPKPAALGVPLSNASKADEPNVGGAYDFDAKTDRLMILKEELRLEESKLESLEAEYNGGKPERKGDEKNYQKYLDRTDRLQQDIKVTKDSIQILKREIAKLLP